MPRPSTSLFRYNSPLVQVVLIGLVCFCCPGMFNALTGMGGGGQMDPTVANNANTALYTTFAVFGVLGGGIYNVLGPHATLFAGCSTYFLYAASFLYYNHYQQQFPAIIAGTFLGVGAGLLWAGQGAIMTSYPPSHQKGIYISMFWSIFNMGGVIGGLIPFILNYHSGGKAASVNDGTYLGFMVFMALGTVLTLAILHPGKVIRDDGSSCANTNGSSISIEIIQILKLFLNWKMLLMVPAAFASNFFYSYQFNDVNGVLFDLRTRGFNNTSYWGAEMIGSVLIGYLMDLSFKSRRNRGLVGIGVVALLGTGIWVGGLVNQLGYSSNDKPTRLDFKDPAFLGPFALYLSYGLLNAMFQTMNYWVIGALADDSETLSRYTGFYKGVQSAGGAVAWQLGSHNVPYLNQLVVNWVMTTVSYPLLAVLVLLAINNDDSKIEEYGNSKEVDFSAEETGIPKFPLAIPASKDDTDTDGGLRMCV